MPIFGQVWLWSVAAFFLGTLLTWLVLVRPAQARIRVLERRLPAVRPQQDRVSAAGPGSAPPDPFLPRSRSLPSRHEPGPAGGFPSGPEPVGEQRPERAWFERDNFGEPLPDDKPVGHSPLRPLEKEFAGLAPVLEPGGGTGIDRTSIFEPGAGEPAEDKRSERGSLFGAAAGQEPGLTSVPAPEPDLTSVPALEPGPGLATVPEPVLVPEPGPELEPAVSGEQEVEAEPASVPEQESDFPALEPPAYAFGGGPAPGNDESSTESTVLLPRRFPRQPSRSEAPLPVHPTMRAVERREPAPPDEPGHSGSLFEPTVRPHSGGAQVVPPSPPPAVAQAAPPSPPPVVPQPAGVPPGPFGPGSAMPRPGGGRPSDEFAVKASVTALRYCTQESPQFQRMVAEVWFRSAAEAERVGFRPLT